MLDQPRHHFFIVALSLVWLFAVCTGAHGEESRTSQSPSVATAADGAMAQNFAAFLKAEEQATKHASDVIEHALAVFTWIVGVVGGLLVAGAALLGWGIARWSRASKTDIQDEVKTQLHGRVSEAIELESKETQRRVAQLSKDADEFIRQLEEAKNRVNSAENTLSELGLLLPLVLTQAERSHLQNLYNGTTANYIGNSNLRTELRRLRYLTLINNPRAPIGTASDGRIFDLQELVELTRLGRIWAKRIQEMPTDVVKEEVTRDQVTT
jgi:hypothetical protein